MHAHTHAHLVIVSKRLLTDGDSSSASPLLSKVGFAKAIYIHPVSVT